MTDPRELEAKFEADDSARAALENLERFGSFRLLEREVKDQDDLYYDTSDERLRRAGASLRLRRVGAKTRMTFKGQRRSIGGAHDHMVSRLEDEVEIPTGSVAHLTGDSALTCDPEPSPLARGREVAGTRDLLPTARLFTQRTVALFEDGPGDRVELALDRVRAVRLSDAREVEFVEVEVELKQGQAKTLVSATSELQREIPGLVPSIRTKLERALE